MIQELALLLTYYQLRDHYLIAAYFLTEKVVGANWQMKYRCMRNGGKSMGVREVRFRTLDNSFNSLSTDIER